MCSEIERNFAVCKLACATVRRIDVCVWQGGIVAGCACLLRVRLASQSLPLALLCCCCLLHMLFGHKRGVQPPHSPPSTAAVFVSTPLSLSVYLSLCFLSVSLCVLSALSTCLPLCFLHTGIGVRQASPSSSPLRSVWAAMSMCCRAPLSSLSLSLSLYLPGHSVHFLQGAVAVAIQNSLSLLPPSLPPTGAPCKRVGFSCPLFPHDSSLGSGAPEVMSSARCAVMKKNPKTTCGCFSTFARSFTSKFIFSFPFLYLISFLYRIRFCIIEFSLLIG